MIEQIKASAGSGKTHTLTMRFLELLGASAGENFPPVCRRLNCRDAGIKPFSEILAMTFTNKAAAEMKERVIKTLKMIAMHPAQHMLGDAQRLFCPQEAALWLNSLLRRYDSLNIRTIDSFLTLLLRISSVTLGIRPDFELAFDDAEYLTPLYDAILDQAAAGDATVQAMLDEAAKALLRFSTTFEGITPKGKIKEHVLQTLSLLQSYPHPPFLNQNELVKRLAQARTDIQTAASSLQAVLSREQISLHQRFITFLERTASYQASDKLPSDSAFATKATLAACMTGASKKSPVPDFLERAYQEFSIHLSTACQKVEIYSSALSLLPFSALASRLIPDLHDLHMQTGRLASSQLPLLARDILTAEYGVSEACCRLGSKLSHLLIDEFQDTSREQWSALKPLAEECLSRAGSLRYVGDVKQAIYSWRGGDASLFDEVTDDSDLLAMSTVPKKERLPVNWRSAPAVVQFNNTMFSMLDQADIAESVMEDLLPKTFPSSEKKLAAVDLCHTFAHTTQGLPKHPKNTATGFVRVVRIPGVTAQEAYLTATQNAFMNMMKHDILKRRYAGDIAILVRKKHEAELVTAWLTQLGQNVVTEHSFRLATHPVISQLVALLRFLDYPPDDLHFFEFLVGDACFGSLTQLSVTEIHAWLHTLRLEQKHRQMHKEPLFIAFRETYPEQWSLFIEPFYNQSGLMSAYDVICEVVKRFQVIERYPTQTAYIRRFLELLHMAENKGYASIASFLDFWDTKGQEEKIPSPEAPDAIRIMTIHKAKGLEFPVVIMPFHRFHDATHYDVCFVNFEGIPLLVRSSPALGAQFFKQQKTSALEKMNLLYVGWTRAREELHLLIEAGDDAHKRGVPGVLQTLFAQTPFQATADFPAGEYTYGKADFAKDLEINNATALQTGSPFSQVKPASTKSTEPDLLKLADAIARQASESTWEPDWQPMRWLPRLKIFRTPIAEAEYDSQTRGILFHECLEHLHIASTPDVTKTFPNAIRISIEHALRTHPLPVDKTEAARLDLHEALTWFCTNPQCRLWLEHGLREQSIMDDQGRLHRIDLLVPQEDGSMLVVDYKSGISREEHRKQIMLYMQLLKMSPKLQGCPIRGMLVYLNADSRGFEEVLI